MNPPGPGMECFETDPAERQYQNFLCVAAEFGDEPPHGDAVFGALCKAIPEAASTNPMYEALIRTYLEIEKVSLTSYQVNKFCKSHSTLMMSGKVRVSTGYPQRFDRPEVWLGQIEEWLSEESQAKYNELLGTLAMPDQKNFAERAKVPAFIASALMRRRSMDSDIVFHEPGSSNAHVLKALSLNEVGNAVLLKQGPNGDEVDTTATVLFNTSTSHVPFKAGIGIDLRPPRTEEDINRVKAFTIPPSQLDGEAEETFDKFTLAQPRNPVKVLDGDFLDLGHRQRRFLKRNPADITFMSHSLSQNASRFDGDIHKVFEAMLPYMKERGLIVVNEYATVDPNDHSIRLTDNWGEKWQCLTAALEVSQPEKGLTPLIQWETSHCKRGKVFEEELSRFALRGLVELG